jgi:hypothetical protein
MEESRQEKLERLRLQREAEKKKKENNLEVTLDSLDKLDIYLDTQLKDEKYGFPELNGEEAIQEVNVELNEVRETIVKIPHKINKIADLIDKFSKIQK